MRILSIFAACFLFATFPVIPSQAGVEVVASKSLTVQPSGPRSGDAGSKYLRSSAKINCPFNYTLGGWCSSTRRGTCPV